MNEFLWSKSGDLFFITTGQGTIEVEKNLLCTVCRVMLVGVKVSNAGKVTNTAWSHVQLLLLRL